MNNKCIGIIGRGYFCYTVKGPKMQSTLFLKWTLYMLVLYESKYVYRFKFDGLEKNCNLKEENVELVGIILTNEYWTA